jgi:hypothetical protein
MSTEEIDLFCYESISDCDFEVSEETLVDRYFDLIMQGENPHMLQLVADTRSANNIKIEN